MNFLFLFGLIAVIVFLFYCGYKDKSEYRHMRIRQFKSVWPKSNSSIHKYNTTLKMFPSRFIHN